MAGTTFVITIVLLVTIIGINSETSTWDGYDVTREISPTKFTQSLTKTVAGVKTVDQTVKLKNALTQEIISIDHSITTTNNGVVTLDRTLEKFYPGGNLKLHDHFFNSSNGDTVIIGNNYTIWYESGAKEINYYEVTRQNNRDPTIHIYRDYVQLNGEPDEYFQMYVVFRADGSKEVYDNRKYVISDIVIIYNVVATIRDSGNQIVDFSETEKELDNLVTSNRRIVAEYRGDVPWIVDTTTENFDQFTNSSTTEHFIIEKNDKGGKVVTNITTEKAADGKERLNAWEAKFDANDKCSSSVDICSHIKSILSKVGENIKEADNLLNNTKSFGRDAYDKFKDIIDKKNIRSST